eukprot:TRINITY_DN34090_c0_g1_i1.p1 TRINITY_DN34090_c0_g1~~TRINITY_DN34090_c0_g1_i1.p1  ORF type:complete len:1107 (+),score=290.85 TRINITY_DN34090_c0_g1_i1:108-3428(+)
MRRLDPGAAVALPPISSVETYADGSGWTMTERRMPGSVGTKKVQASPRKSPASTEGQAAPQSARERREQPKDQFDRSGSFDSGDPGGDGDDGLNVPLPGPKGGPTVKGKAIESWLNHTLGQAYKKPEGGDVAAAEAKKGQGMAQFGIDNSALERLGLDPAAADRVYRAMFVYSQGMHAVLQEAVGRAKNSSTALLVLWRAFQAVLEQAGQAEEHGAESLAALVQRGSEEEKERVEGQFRDQISSLQGQCQRLGQERRTLQEELQRVKEDEMRLRNESEMYRNEHDNIMAKYENELKLRTDAEVKFLDKTRHCEALQEELNKAYTEIASVKESLRNEMTANASAKQELDALNAQNKVLDSQVNMLRQQVQEASVYKQRVEQQVALLKQQMDRIGGKSSELQEQLDLEQAENKRLTDEISNKQREMRRLERENEDEAHVRKELQNERDLLRDKVGRMDKDISGVMEERRSIQKQFNDLNLEHRTVLMDLKRKVDALDRTEKSFEKLQANHKELQDEHRAVTVEAEHLRDDVQHLEGQVSKESELRKSLQSEKKMLTTQVQSLQVQLETTQLAVQSTQRELTEVTEAKVKLESVMRDTKSAMRKITLEQQVELKAHNQKVSMLEKVIADERTERRNLVTETQEVNATRDEALDTLREVRLEVRELKRQRLEREEEVDRLKVLLQAQEQRNAEQLVTVDKYHATVAGHESEMRQMQVLLECEREEQQKQLVELQESFAAAQHSLVQRIDQMKLKYEDLRSRQAFTDASTKIKPLEDEVAKLKVELEQAQDFIEKENQRVKHKEDSLRRKDKVITELKEKVEAAHLEKETMRGQSEGHIKQIDRTRFALSDLEEAYARICQSREEALAARAELERQVAEQKEQIKKAVELAAQDSGSEVVIKKQTADASTQVIIPISTSTVQTDLSYQYLESATHMHQGTGRQDQLAALKEAGHFVEDPNERRDFNVQTRTTSSIPTAQLGASGGVVTGGRSARTTMSLLAEDALNDGMGDAHGHGASGYGESMYRESTYKPVSTYSAMSPQVPDPWPSVSPPAGPIPRGANKLLAMRQSRQQAKGIPSHGGIMVSQVKTTVKSPLPAELQKASKHSPSPR